MKTTATKPPGGTIRDWLNWRAENGGTAIIFPETGFHLKWGSLRKGAIEFASLLASLGVKKSESVAIMAPNGLESVTAFFGAAYGGYRATMINLAAGRDAISYALEHSEARFCHVHADCLEPFSEANDSGVKALPPEGVDTGVVPEIPSPEDHALLMYTSGTTGRPKGVVHTHQSLLAGGWTSAMAHDLSTNDRGLCVLPIYHINGLCVTLMGSLVSGGSLIMPARFSASRFWNQSCKYKATWFSAVPTIISHLLHGDAAPDEMCRKRFRFGRSASSALALETQNAFERRFSIPIVETMGLTETAAQILSNPLPPGRRKMGSPGRAFGCEVEIQDDDGGRVLRDREGEIAVRGPNVMLEYLKDPGATVKAFRNGWFRTGDLARMDGDGYVFVTGRLKELIIKGGENIAPREIDEVLYSHPDVIEAAAFARKCPRYGETVEAAVRVRPDSKVGPAELSELCAKRLGSFKTPDKIHFFSELPKGPSGKIQRLKLADML
ncbi:MAG: AMP-binding protein [Roseovarius sp.]|nr:AMP-binding protein [Roseovarius sp.]